MKNRLTFGTVCALLVSASGATLAQDCSRWWQRDVPRARSNHTMVFDSHRGVTVLWGGRNSELVYQYVWEWDGTSWRGALPEIEPPEFAPHVMVFDTARNVTLAHGDLGTWSWNGATWTELTADVPFNADNNTVMAFDDARGVAVLFGNYIDTNNGFHTFEWDGSAWTPVADSGPAERGDVWMTYDAEREVCLMVNADNETWSWDGTAWENLGDAPGHGPISFDSGRGVTVLYDSNFTHEFDGTTWTSIGAARFDDRDYAAMAYDSWRGQTVLFGGAVRDDLLFADLWEWDGSLWRERMNAAPLPEYNHKMVYDSARGEALIFGGQGPVGSRVVALSQTWGYRDKTWSLLAEFGPSPRDGHAMAYDSAREVVVLTGGGDDARDRETWEWNGTVWTFRNDNAFSPRRDHAMAYDSARGVTVLFGGWDGDYDDETWEWDGTAWTRQDVSGPEGRRYHAMAYDPVRDVTVLYGGTSGGSPLTSTWEWDGQAWSSHTSIRFPDPNDNPDLVFDPESNRVVTHVNGTTWSWDGSSWTSEDDDRYSSVPELVYDTERGVLFGFGDRESPFDRSRSSVVFDERDLSILVQPSDVNASEGDDAEFRVIGDGNAAPTYQWRKDGVPLNNGLRISGTDSPVLVITDLTGSDDGVYDCIVDDGCAQLVSDGASLVLRCSAADFNGDGSVNTLDFLDFLNAWAVGDMSADFNDDGTVDTLDVLAFLNAWNAGC